jgi:hypothetical protein
VRVDDSRRRRQQRGHAADRGLELADLVGRERHQGFVAAEAIGRGELGALREEDELLFGGRDEELPAATVVDAAVGAIAVESAPPGDAEAGLQLAGA